MARLGGGIAVQDRLAFAGERFVERYGQAAADAKPPIKAMLSAGVPVGAGSDATRVASYNPWVSLYWLVTGQTLGSHQLWSEHARLDRMEALRLYSQGSAWFSREEQLKGDRAGGCQSCTVSVSPRDAFDGGRGS